MPTNDIDSSTAALHLSGVVTPSRCTRAPCPSAAEYSAPAGTFATAPANDTPSCWTPTDTA